ncbi:MAG: ornithine carbamoyltransferase, partial [Actinobacteria bacterium]|nr:ornithine carbamoyltransferase [Actinomycetota bacterium]
TLNVLELDDLTAIQVASVLDNAAQWKRDPAGIPQALKGKGVALVFEKPSARTRLSSEMAVATLSGHPIYIRPEELGIGTRETAEDVARTLGSYCAIIAARVFDHAVLEQMSAVSKVPVINLLSDRSHPCQGLADVLTIRELFGTVEGRRLAYIGDGNNVTASLAFAAALTGLELIVSSPPGYELDPEVVESARNLGGSITLIQDPIEAAQGVDAVYTDVWASMGEEAEAEERRVVFAGWQVDDRVMSAASKDAWFLHCLPAHRGEEVTASVIDGDRSAVWAQAANRMHTARALFALVVTEAGAD